MTTMEECLNISNTTFKDPEGGGAAEREQGGDEYTQQLAMQVEHYVMKLGIPVFSGLGLVGNFLALLVLVKEKLCKSLTKMEISANTGLIGLAVSDLMFCLMVLLITVLPLKTYYSPGDVMVYFDVSLGGCITVFIVTSTCLIVIMAAERYVAVCHPLKARRFISLKRTRAYVILPFVLCPLFTLPVFMEKYISHVTCADGSTLYTVNTVPRDSVVVRRIVWSMCFDLVPCCALIFFNACLICKIHKTKKLRKKMTPPHSFCAQNADKNKMRRCFRWDSNQAESSQLPRRHLRSSMFFNAKTPLAACQNSCPCNYQASEKRSRPVVIRTPRAHRNTFQTDGNTFCIEFRNSFPASNSCHGCRSTFSEDGSLSRGNFNSSRTNDDLCGEPEEAARFLGFRSSELPSSSSCRSGSRHDRQLLQEKETERRSPTQQFSGTSCYHRNR